MTDRNPRKRGKMEPVSPIIEGFEKDEFRVGESQVQFMTMPVVFVIPKDAESTASVPSLQIDEVMRLSRWRPSDEERQRIADGDDIYLWLQCGVGKQPPVQLTVGPPQTTEEAPIEKLLIVSDTEA